MNKEKNLKDQRASLRVDTRETQQLPLWLDLKMVTYSKISPKTANPREIAGNTEEEEAMVLTLQSQVSGILVDSLQH